MALRFQRYNGSTWDDITLAFKGEPGGDGVGDMQKSVYDPDNDGVVDAAASAPWGGITGKPQVYPPSTHNHDGEYDPLGAADAELAAHVLAHNHAQIPHANRASLDKIGESEGGGPTWDGGPWPGGGGASTLDDLNDVVITTPTKNQTILYNGTSFVNAAPGTSFTFSVASFTATGFATGTVLVGGTGATWIAAGAVTFSATYSNGPATGGYVSHSGHSNLTLAGAGFTGPTVNAEAYVYPAPGSSKTVTLNATDGTDPTTSSKTATFQNYIKYGSTSKASGYDQSDFNGMSQSATTGDNTQTWNSVNLSNEYFTMWVPTRLGRPTYFYDNATGLQVDMLAQGSTETVSISNGNGFTENFYVFRTTNSMTYSGFTMRTA
jgi:hypothetical protein